jgi:alpha-mannosidase
MFEYALCPHAGDWQDANLTTVSSVWNTPVRAMQIGRGKGDLPHEQSLLALQGKGIKISAIKPAEDGDGIVVRLFNTTADTQTARLQLEREAVCTRIRMDESVVERLGSFKTLEFPVAAKKIVSVKVML